MTGATCGIKFDAQTKGGPSWLSQHRHHSWVPVWFAPVGGFAPTLLETYGSIFSPFPQKWGNSGHYDSWLFHKGCLSLHSWWDAMLAHNGTYWVWDVLAFRLYRVLSFENRLARILAAACATTEKHWCPVSTFSYFRGKAFLGKPAIITFIDLNLWIKFRL